MRHGGAGEFVDLTEVESGATVVRAADQRRMVGTTWDDSREQDGGRAGRGCDAGPYSGRPGGWYQRA